MAQTVPLRIVYVFEDGAESDMALGTISREGVLETTKIADGQEKAVETLVSELNASDRVFLREMVTSPRTGMGSMAKIPVERGTPGFLAALQETAKRFYKLELRFDPKAFDGGTTIQTGGGESAEDVLDEKISEPDMTPRENAKPGIDV